MAKKIFVNLPVKDLKKSVNFFSSLGFTFDQRFTDENAACLIIGSGMYAMLLIEDFFKKLIPEKNIANTEKNSEVIIALSAENKEEVNEMINNAIKAGGKEYRKGEDYGWMYTRSFQDMDNHIWEVLYMDENSMPEEMKNRGAK